MKLHRLVASLFIALLAAPLATMAAANITVWDTGSRAAATVNLDDRAQWKQVPSNLLELEKDPLKAASDPGYYGRDYNIGGDVVVENSRLVAAFTGNSGRVTLFSKTGQRIAEVAPLKGGGAPVKKFELVRNFADEVVLDVFFAGETNVTFSFAKNEIVEITPSVAMRGVRVSAPISYAVAPAFVGDDLIFGAVEEAANDYLTPPLENMLLGLVQGEDHELVMTWPQGDQQVRLKLGAEVDKKRAIEAVEISNDAQSIFLAVLSAPGIWHREALTDAAFLEKDAEIDWLRPFPAKWQTQLVEGSVKTTYSFREAKGTIWRGVGGMYDYPVRFDGTKAIYHLSKKVRAKGESIVYFLEGNNTPDTVLTPVDVLKMTLGRPAAESILDVAGRRLRTHHGDSGSGVHRACTCGYTEAIQAVFEKGEETEQRSFIDQSIGDMIYFVRRHLERIDEYRAFAKEMESFMQSKGKEIVEVKPYLEELLPIVQQIPQEYENQKENMKSLAYADELSKRTMALTEKKDPDNLKAFMELLKLWRGMGGAADGVVAQYHMQTRRLFQEAGYLAANDPKATKVATEIRARCQKILRNPDGYEIWANY